MTMRALVDWYCTAHPPIMHDLHEAQPLLYTYSGGPPQNPNLDPMLFAELPFFSNWEIAQMTKWGMPGVYTHAFMDGWSPGYLGSVAYNHNGMMKMYETQSGVRHRPRRRPRGGTPAAAATPPAAGDAGRAAGAAGAAARPARGGGGRGGGAEAAAAAGVAAARPEPEPAGLARPEVPGNWAARGHSRPRRPFSSSRAADVRAVRAALVRAACRPGRRADRPRPGQPGTRVVPRHSGAAGRHGELHAPQQHELHADGVLSALQLTSMFPNLVVENFYRKTQNSIDQGKTDAAVRLRADPEQRDMTKPAELVAHPADAGHRGRHGPPRRSRSATTRIRPARTSSKGDQPYWRLAKNLLEKQDYPDATLTTYDDSGWTMGCAFIVDVKEDRRQGDPRRAGAARDGVRRPRARSPASGSAGLAVAHYGSNNMISFRYKLRSVADEDRREELHGERRRVPGRIVRHHRARSDADARAAVEKFGLTAVALSELPSVPMHDADAPRVAIYSAVEQHAGPRLVPLRVRQVRHSVRPDLQGAGHARAISKADYDVIIMAAQNLGRAAVAAGAGGAARSRTRRATSTSSSAMYGETPDMSGGFGQEGVDAFAKFLEAGGTLITAGQAVALPDRVRLRAHDRHVVGSRVAGLQRAEAARRRRRSCRPSIRCSTATRTRCCR